MGQILPGVPVWSMASNSRWPGLPLVVFPGNVGGTEALAEAMIKVGLTCFIRFLCVCVSCMLYRVCWYRVLYPYVLP